MNTCLKQNNLIDTSIQKAGVPGFSGCLEAPVRDWKMQVNLYQQHKFPAEILNTNLRPDLVLWSTSQKSLFIMELTAVGEAFERKKLKYTDIAFEARQRGWCAQVLPVEVGCRGFVATSIVKPPEGGGSSGTGLQESRQITVGGGGAGQQVDLDKEEGPQLGCKKQ